jgi:hypothetical protein
MRMRGPYLTGEHYKRFDLATFGPDLFIAKRHDPGLCPGDDWLRLTGARGEPGARGQPGLRGHKGNPGPSGARITEWRLAREKYVVVPFLSDGRAGAPLRLRGLFEQFFQETSE